RQSPQVVLDQTGIRSGGWRYRSTRGNAGGPRVVRLQGQSQIAAKVGEQLTKKSRAVQDVLPGTPKD
ncbi:hypothetical protein, partial [Acidithiobacillus sp.]|uniref:hypothetical protein n=1 Tax=Acidithiobacillus sp. TaxID=1872118 RepID=UPI003D0820D4